MEYIPKEPFAEYLCGKIAEAMADGANEAAIVLIETLTKLNGTPASGVVPAKVGTWIESDGCQSCSECGEEHEWGEYQANYCDNCGTRMKEGLV